MKVNMIQNSFKTPVQSLLLWKDTVNNLHYFMRKRLTIIKWVNREATSSSVVWEDFGESLRIIGFGLKDSGRGIKTNGGICNGRGL